MSWFPAEFHQRGLIGVRSGIFPRTGCQPFPPTNQPYQKQRKWNRIYILCALSLDRNPLEAASCLGAGQTVSLQKFHTNLERFHLQDSSGYQSRISNDTTASPQNTEGTLETPGALSQFQILEKLQKSCKSLTKSIIYQEPLKGLVVCFAAVSLIFSIVIKMHS